MNLFCVKNSKNKIVEHPVDLEDGNVVTEKYFHNKMEAKKWRDECGGNKEGMRVSKGPDHMGKHGEQPYPKMRRQPK